MFEKFTQRSRRALILAQEEARILSHRGIGTEHLLLGLIAEDEGVAARALKSFGMSLHTTRDRVEQMIGLTPSPDTAPPFTPRVKMVLELSLRESIDLGHDYVGTEHLLLGLIREGGGMATQVLRSFDVDGDDLRQRVIRLFSDDQENTNGPSRSAFEPRCTGCQSPLSETARFRTIEIQPSSPGPLPITIDVPFCIGCGLVLGSFRSETTR